MKKTPNTLFIPTSVAISLRVAAIVGALILSSLASYATPVTVPNASFETPSSPTQTSTNANLISGWVFSVKGGSEFGTMAISSNFTSSGASSGNDCAFINNDALNETDTITSAASLTTIAPLTDYTLTVAIGNVQGTDSSLYGSPGPVSFSLLANGSVIATESVPNKTVPNGTFEEFNLTYASPAVGQVIGENLTIQLATLPQQGSAYKAAFDNITLDATPIAPSVTAPEPKTWALLLSGLISLYWLMRQPLRSRDTGDETGRVLGAFLLRAIIRCGKRESKCTALLISRS